MKKEFNELIELLEKSYEVQPKTTIEEITNALDRINKPPNESIFNGMNMNLFKTIILIIIITFIGLFQIGNYYFYFFGIVFFIVGLLIGLYIPGFGLIFLISHGGSGLALMLYALLEPVISSPLMTDNPVLIYVYLVILIIITIINLIIILLYNLSPGFRKRENIVHIVLIIFIVVLFLAGLLPYIVNLLY